jgi:hypothetical protein
MGGGLMQLVAYGAQDIYLTGQPQITFFKSVYRRHTNFAIESIQQTINGNLSFGTQVSITVSRNGDLLKKMWIELSPQNMLSGVVGTGGSVVSANISHAIIDHLDLEIGGQLIDRHYGKWLTIWKYLSQCDSEGSQGPIDENGYGPGEQPLPNGDNASNTYLPRPTKYDRMAYTHKANLAVTSNSGAPLVSWVPLEFWFCRNPGLALPLIALQYHEVKLSIYFNNYNSFTNAPKPTGQEFTNFKVYADYVYLDTTERRQFAQNAHEYLIDQLQVNQNLLKNTVRLNFNHPVKELIWTIPPSPYVTPTYVPGQSGPAGFSSPPAQFTQSTATQANNYKIVLNGTDRFSERDINYFTRNQVWEAHSGFGSVLFPDSIAVYSFALRPEEHQPSGTCNFSRIDTAELSRTIAQPIDVYAVNYNVLRIMSGMGGLAYSN